jgi:hypothetical protein
MLITEARKRKRRRQVLRALRTENEQLRGELVLTRIRRDRDDAETLRGVKALEEQIAEQRELRQIDGKIQAQAISQLSAQLVASQQERDTLTALVRKGLSIISIGVDALDEIHDQSLRRLAALGLAEEYRRLAVLLRNVEESKVGDGKEATTSYALAT